MVTPASTTPANVSLPILRINRIASHRAFRDFSWPSGLLEFARYNVIYGWNGSGKTTFANLFGLLARRTDLTEGSVEFQIDGRSVAGNTFSSTAGLPEIRVFNRDFIAASVFTSETPLGAIYYFGEESVEKQKELDALKTALTQAESAAASAQTEKQAADRRLDEFCVAQARIVKELLTASGGGPYNNYNKTDFKRRCEGLGTTASSHLIDEAANAALKQQKDAQPKSAVVLGPASYPDLAALRSTTEARLDTTVVSRTIDHLVQHPTVAAWVKEGIALHPGGTEPRVCEFCRNPISPDRMGELEGHFNDQYEGFLRTVSSELNSLERIAESVRTRDLPDEAKLYDHLRDAYRAATAELIDAEKAVVAYVDALVRALRDKKEKPFQRLLVAEFVAGAEANASETAQIKRAEVDRILTEHNQHTNNFQSSIKEARQKLELGLAAEAHGEFSRLVEGVTSAAESVRSGGERVAEIRAKAAILERSLVEHLRPAEELNAEMRAFLGRSDLKLSVQETGYTITRDGRPASNLSEGEKTAIAFLYFLKGLQDRAFQIETGVVVIDDPISSLDANALFCAFGHLKERTKNAGQLFILTHNFSFFRQVRNWFHHLPGQGKKDASQRPARFYMLGGVSTASGERTAVLAPLDPLLEQFESEYHYLFSRVYKESQRATPAASLEEYYPLPNVARRLLESFLAFRYPGSSGDLAKKLERVGFDAKKKVRVLRFLHTYSHGDRIEEPSHDPSLLGETPQVLAELLELIGSEDPHHHSEMMNLIASPIAPS